MEEYEQLVQLDLDHLLHPMQGRAHNVNGPMIIVEGSGSVVKDAAGKEYIDAFSGLWNVNVGHGRTELGQAASEQMDTLAFTSSFAGSSNVPAIKLAARLAKMAPGDLRATFFTTGGAESIETALKMARFYWKMQGKPEKSKVISRRMGYHGLTGAALSTTGIRQFWHNFDPLEPGYVHIPTHYCFRCAWHQSYPQCGTPCADVLEQMLIGEDPETVAAFVAEPVQGAGGLVPPPPEYFPKIREICNKYDILFIADEIITGFGRTGKMFGLEHWDTPADLMAFAKGITSGYVPLGGVMVNERVHKVFRDLPDGVSFDHGYTYSAHPTCCAVALKNLDIIEGEGLVSNARERGDQLMAGLKQLSRLKGVGDVRGLGLMAAVELAADKHGTPLPDAAAVDGKVGAYLKDHGIITRVKGSIISLAPPLVITKQQVDRIVDTIGEAIGAAVR
jgi:putrescine---pyruvate transaminase